MVLMTTQKHITVPMLADYAEELNVMAQSISEVVYSNSADMRAKIDSLMDRYAHLTLMARSLDIEYIEANYHRLK